jgi:hypothetical protein
MCTGALSPGVKHPGHEADHSPPASAEVKKMLICTSTPPYAFMAYRDNFTLEHYIKRNDVIYTGYLGFRNHCYGGLGL